MALTNEHVGPMILAKIKIYVFTRAELLFQVCYETPCMSQAPSKWIELKKSFCSGFLPYESLEILESKTRKGPFF